MDSEGGSYEKIIKPMEGQMIRCVWRIVRNTDDAEDAFQDALAKVLTRLEYIKVHPNPQALILRFCLNAAYDHLRKAVARRSHETARAVVGDASDSAPGATEILVAREREEAVLRAIGRLPRRQAETVLMRVVLGQSYGAIAQALGCDEATVRSHFSRGRAALADELRPMLEEKSREVRS